MDARETTINNADLWARFLTDQWTAWLDPFGLGSRRVETDPTRVIAETAAANVASFVGLLVKQPIERMYESNAPDVTRFVQETSTACGAVEIPPEFARGSSAGVDDRRAVPERVPDLLIATH